MKILKIKDWKGKNSSYLNKHNIKSWAQKFYDELAENGFSTVNSVGLIEYCFRNFQGLTPYEACCKYTGTTDEYEF